jgi:hypothetical protein
MADAEVDRLLREATDIAAEIVHETGVSQEPKQSAQTPEVPLENQPDAEAAVAKVASDLAEVREQITEAPNESAAKPAVEPSPANEPPVAAEKYARVEPVVAKPPRQSPRLAKADADDHARPAEAADASKSEAAPEAAGPRKWKLVIQTAFAVFLAPLRLIVVALELFDKPFGRWSSGTKQALGLAALITLIMGGASFVLPGMLRGNPYAAIPLYKSVEPPAAAAGH